MTGAGGGGDRRAAYRHRHEPGGAGSPALRRHRALGAPVPACASAVRLAPSCAQSSCARDGLAMHRAEPAPADQRQDAERIAPVGLDRHGLQRALHLTVFIRTASNPTSRKCQCSHGDSGPASSPTRTMARSRSRSNAISGSGSQMTSPRARQRRTGSPRRRGNSRATRHANKMIHGLVLPCGLLPPTGTVGHDRTIADSCQTPQCNAGAGGPCHLRHLYRRLALGQIP